MARMAARESLLAFVKWFVVPAALGATGFYFLGPRLGEKAAAPASKTSPSAEPDATEQPTSSIVAFPSPSVNIDARPMNESASNSQKPPKKRRRRRTPAPSASPSAPPADAPPGDGNPPDNVPPPAGKADGDGL